MFVQCHACSALFSLCSSVNQLWAPAAQTLMGRRAKGQECHILREMTC